MVIKRYSEIDKLGPQGDRGDTGEAGIPGDKGPTGLRGDIGPKGDKGDKGDKGETGEIGDKGYKGEDGPRGYDGDRGDRGEPGDKGPKGPKGNKGERGIDGKDGIQGQKGPKGDKGPRGEAGNKGPIGLRGRKGDTGDKGPTGDMGPKGDDGEKGFKGDAGDRGIPGTQGDKGISGPPGPKGDIGPKGERGEIGKSNCDIILPSSIMMEKSLQLIKNNAALIYLILNTPIGIPLPGTTSDDSKARIESIELGCVTFQGGAVIPIENIQTINVLYMDEMNRDSLATKMKAMFQSVKDCNKNAPQTLNLDENNQPITVDQLSYDYEYVPRCKCINGECVCIGEKIDISKYTSYESEYLRKLIEIETMKNRKITNIISGNGEGIGIPYRIKGDVTMLESCLGTLVLTYTVERLRLEGQFQDNFILSIVNLENVSAIKII